MQTKIGAGPALEPRPQSTRATQLVARGYTPLRPARRPGFLEQTFKLTRLAGT
jgi:hypothetical protein